MPAMTATANVSGANRARELAAEDRDLQRHELDVHHRPHDEEHQA